MSEHNDPATDLRANRRRDLGQIEPVLDDHVELEAQSLGATFDADSVAPEDASDTRVLIALDRILHDVKADQADERAANQRHQAAEPGRVKDTTIVVQAKYNMASVGRVSEINRKR